MIPIDKVQDIIIAKYDNLEKELSSEILTQNYLPKNQKNILIRKYNFLCSRVYKI